MKPVKEDIAIHDIGLYIQAHEGLLNELYVYFLLFEKSHDSTKTVKDYVDNINNIIKYNVDSIDVKSKKFEPINKTYNKENKNISDVHKKQLVYKYFIDNFKEIIIEYDNDKKPIYIKEDAIENDNNNIFENLNSIITTGNNDTSIDNTYFDIMNTFMKTMNAIINSNSSYIESLRIISFFNTILLHSLGFKNSDNGMFPICENIKKDIADGDFNKIFKYIIISLDKSVNTNNQRYNLFINMILFCYVSVCKLYNKSNIPSLCILEPSEHVNAPVGRNMAFNFIRQHKNIFKNTIWLGSDSDDDIDINKVVEYYDHIINNYTIDNILLLNKYQTNYDKNGIQKGIKRYAAWSYMFSPIIYYMLSYRCTPMNKEDLDFYNRLINIDYTKVIRLNDNKQDTGIYNYGSSQGDTYEKYAMFKNVNIIGYMNKHHFQEAKDANGNNIGVPSQSTSDISSKNFYVNNGHLGYLMDTYDTRVKDESYEREHRHYFGLPFHDMNNNEPYRADDYDRYANTTPNYEIKYKFSNENYKGDVYILKYKYYNFKCGESYQCMDLLMFQNGKIPTEDDLTNIGYKQFIESKVDKSDVNKYLKVFDIMNTDDIKNYVDGIINEWNTNLLEYAEMYSELIPITGPYKDLKGNKYPRVFGGSDIITKIIYCLSYIIIFVIIISFIVCCIRYIKNNYYSVC